MIMWVMSDRAIPRSFRMMQGFGVHTFRLVNAAGESRFVKFHWRPVLGTHSVDWDEAVKISGADPDFHRRDLWEAIEAGDYPEWELGLQIFTEEEAKAFSFDVLDATKIVPEELVPVTPVGRMVLNRNPDNFFAETEQVAFCAAHIVPGHRLFQRSAARRTHPLLRRHADLAARRAELPRDPINAPVAQVHNNQRDGMHRQAIPRGRVAYEPNSLAGGCPFQAGMKGFTSFPEPVQEDKVRGKPEKFADHYSQATLFWNSQTPVEKAHIIRAFRFELTKVQVPAVRERVVAMLRNVDDELAEAVAAGLGMDDASIRCRSRSRAATAGSEDLAGAIAVRATRRRQHSHAARRHPGRGGRRQRGRKGDARRIDRARRRRALRRRATWPRRERRRRSARSRSHDGDDAVGTVRRDRSAGWRRRSQDPRRPRSRR